LTRPSIDFCVIIEPVMKFKNIAAQETSSIHKLFEDNQKVHIKLAKIYQNLSILYPEDSNVWRELYIDEMNFFVNLFAKLKSLSDQDLLGELLISPAELKQIESYLDQLAKRIRYRTITKDNLYALILKIERDKDSFHNAGNLQRFCRMSNGNRFF